MHDCQTCSYTYIMTKLRLNIFTAQEQKVASGSYNINAGQWYSLELDAKVRYILMLAYFVSIMPW